MTAPPPAPPTADAAPPARKRRRGLVWGLIVLAGIIVLVASLSVWVQRQALDTDSWTNTSASLLEDDQVRRRSPCTSSTSVRERRRPRARLEARLPEGAQALAPTLAAAIRGPAQNAVERLLDRPRTQAAWKNLNRIAHERLIAVLEGNPRKNVSTENGNVVLDLRSFVVDIGAEPRPRGTSGRGASSRRRPGDDPGVGSARHGTEGGQGDQGAQLGVRDRRVRALGRRALACGRLASGRAARDRSEPAAGRAARARRPSTGGGTTSSTRSRRPARPGTRGTGSGSSPARSWPRSAGPASSTGSRSSSARGSQARAATPSRAAPTWHRPWSAVPSRRGSSSASRSCSSSGGLRRRPSARCSACSCSRLWSRLASPRSYARSAPSRPASRRRSTHRRLPRRRSRQSEARKGFLSGPGRDRTCDLGIKSPLLYQLSYRPAILLVGKGYAEGSAVEERQAALERGDDPTRRSTPVARPSTAAPTTSRSGTSSAGPTRSTPTRSSPRARRGASRSSAVGLRTVGRAPTRPAGARRGGAGRR